MKFNNYEGKYTDEDLTTMGNDEMMSATERAYWLVENCELDEDEAIENISSVVVEFMDDRNESNKVVMDLWMTYKDFLKDGGKPVYGH